MGSLVGLRALPGLQAEKATGKGAQVMDAEALRVAVARVRDATTRLGQARARLDESMAALERHAQDSLAAITPATMVWMYGFAVREAEEERDAAWATLLDMLDKGLAAQDVSGSA